MTADEVKNLLTPGFAQADIRVEGEGAKFLVTIVAEEFSGLRAVPRQQKVYGLLNDHIASGEIHAVTMNLKTPAELA